MPGIPRALTRIPSEAVRLSLGMNPELLVVGEPLVEFNQVRPGGVEWVQGHGGDVSNLAVAAARSGARSGCISRLGDDPFGQSIRDLWEVEGVDASAVSVDARAPTGLYFVIHGPTGHEFFYRRAGSAASLLGPGDLPRERIRTARMVHASAITLALSPSARAAAETAWAEARAAGVPTSFDPNLRLRLWSLEDARPVIARAAAGVDHFFPSLDDARVLAGTDNLDGALAWAHALGPRWVYLKLGAQGVVVSDGVRRVHIGGHRVQAVDATGAGDCFAGVTLARILAGDDPWTAARHGNAAAALATTGFGAVAPIPRPDAIRALLGGAGSTPPTPDSPPAPIRP